MLANTNDSTHHPVARRRFGPRATGRPWDWSSVVTAAALVAVPIVGAAILTPMHSDSEWLVAVDLLVSSSVVALAAVALDVRARMAGGRVIGWLAAALMTLGVHGAAEAGIRLTQPEAALASARWMLVVEMCTTSVLVVLVLLARRRTLKLDPVVVGIVLGVLLGAMRYVVVFDVKPSPSRSLPLLGLWVVASLMFVLLCWAVASLPGLPRTSRVGLAGAAGLLLAGETAAYAPQWVVDSGSTVPIGLTSAGAVLVLALSLSLLTWSMERHRNDVAQLNTHLERVRARRRVDRARLHEIGASISSISAASSMLKQRDLHPERRSRIERMLAVEVERLRALVDPSTAAPAGSVQLDEVLDHVATMHQLQGLCVEWVPVRQTVHGRFDDLVATLNTLLVNAVVHGRARRVTITSSVADGRVSLTVRDSGSGLPTDLGDRLFRWGAKGSRSAGQGIGLHEARRLVQHEGGSLALAPPGPSGAGFIIDLPLAEQLSPIG